MDRLTVTALRAIPLDRIDPLTDDSNTDAIPLLRNERALRILIGSKRSWNWSDPDTNNKNATGKIYNSLVITPRRTAISATSSRDDDGCRVGGGVEAKPDNDVIVDNEGGAKCETTTSAVTAAAAFSPAISSSSGLASTPLPTRWQPLSSSRRDATPTAYSRQRGVVSRRRRDYDISFRTRRRFVVGSVSPDEESSPIVVDSQWLDSLNALGCVAYESSASSSSSTQSSKGGPSSGHRSVVAYLPPYEYCSVPIFNQARLVGNGDIAVAANAANTRRGERASSSSAPMCRNNGGGSGYCGDIVSDRGGTIKSVLQSSKSFVHVLTTHPLKNTFRAYIQIRPYLSFGDIGLPRHHAVRIFSLNVVRDATKCVWRPLRCGGASCATNANVVRRSRSCPIWPDESFDFYFETTQNFGLFFKRDPCIHNGSVVPVSRVYVTDGFRSYDESVYVSSFSLKNLNADFDGDTVTVMIVRGIEATCELNECLSEPFLYGITPRFTFCQSLVHRLFRRLCYGQRDEIHSLCHRRRRRRRCRDDDSSVGGDDDEIPSPTSVKRTLIHRLNVWRNSKARERARRVMGPWYAYYLRALDTIWRGKSRDASADDWWTIPVWSQPVLDRAHVLAVRDGRGNMLDWMVTRGCPPLNEKNDDRTVLLDSNPLCMENWLIVHSGAKSSPMELWNLYERFRAAIVPVATDDRRDSRSLSTAVANAANANDGPSTLPITATKYQGSLKNENVEDRCENHEDDEDDDDDDDDETVAASSFTNAQLSPHDDFLAECSEERASAYSRYLNDFVTVSKSVPKGSYFASGLKWVVQKCTVERDCLSMNGIALLRNFSYYLKDIERDHSS